MLSNPLIYYKQKLKLSDNVRVKPFLLNFKDYLSLSIQQNWDLEITFIDNDIKQNMKVSKNESINFYLEQIGYNLDDWKIQINLKSNRQVKLLDGSKTFNELEIQSRSEVEISQAIKCRCDLLFVQVVGGQRIQMYIDTQEDRIVDIKQKLLKEIGVPPQRQTIMQQFRILEDDKKLHEYNITDRGTLCASYKLLGGKAFVDVSNYNNLIDYQFSETAHWFNTMGYGLNLFGYCHKEDCEAEGKQVTHAYDFQEFILGYSQVKCPACLQEIEPINCGFYNCNWSYKGQKLFDGRPLVGQWKECNINGYQSFASGQQDSIIQWEKLIIQVRPLGDKVPQIEQKSKEGSNAEVKENVINLKDKLEDNGQASCCCFPRRKTQVTSSSKIVESTANEDENVYVESELPLSQAQLYHQDLCIFCLEELCQNDVQDIVLQCGHHFHRDCVQSWRTYSDNSKKSCPICGN